MAQTELTITLLTPRYDTELTITLLTPRYDTCLLYTSDAADER